MSWRDEDEGKEDFQRHGRWGRDEDRYWNDWDYRQGFDEARRAEEERQAQEERDRLEEKRRQDEEAYEAEQEAERQRAEYEYWAEKESHAREIENLLCGCSHSGSYHLTVELDLCPCKQCSCTGFESDMLKYLERIHAEKTV